MASTPSFDPNLIIKKPNNNYWQSLLNHPLSPLTNRSIQGLYSPGSTFKMIVALAGLKNKKITNLLMMFKLLILLSILTFAFIICLLNYMNKGIVATGSQEATDAGER